MEPLQANSWSEAYFYLKVTPCGDCGQGPWELQAEQQQPAAAPPAEGDTSRCLRARCVHCSAEREFFFRCVESPHRQQLEPLGLEPVNPTDHPSRIIDLAGWLSLFYMLVESASKADDKPTGRRLTFQAAQCLDEALKFYAPDDDLPPGEAFFSDRSGQTFADHPEKFARERLRQMRSKLPDLNLMVRRLAKEVAAKKRWWQFWK